MLCKNFILHALFKAAQYIYEKREGSGAGSGVGSGSVPLINGSGSCDPDPVPDPDPQHWLWHTILGWHVLAYPEKISTCCHVT